MTIDNLATLAPSNTQVVMSLDLSKTHDFDIGKLDLKLVLAFRGDFD